MVAVSLAVKQDTAPPPGGTARRLAEVRARMEQAAARAGRAADQVRLAAVGKGHSAEAVRDAYRAGHRLFAESRGQELARKAQESPSDIEWHFVGPLQTNKVRLVRPRVALLHSLDRPRLLKAWMEQGPDGERVPPALLQINIGREPQKGGVEPDGAAETFERWEEAGAPLAGLTAIPPLGADPESSRPYFARMKEIGDLLSARLGRPLILSMGMTDDFETAIEEGSTLIRVGRAIFGPRSGDETGP